MLVKKLFLGTTRFLQVAAFPILYTWGSLTWSWPLGWALAMTLALALMHPLKQVAWGCGLGLVFGVLACIGQWRLLPLVIAQVGLAYLLSTQALKPRWQATLWFIQVYFNQTLLLVVLMHVLTPMSLLVLALLSLPFILAMWSDQLPIWGVLAALLAVIAVGYWTQQLTLIAAGCLLVIPCLISPRVTPMRPIVYDWASIIMIVIFNLTRLHG